MPPGIGLPAQFGAGLPIALDQFVGDPFSNPLDLLDARSVENLRLGDVALTGCLACCAVDPLPARRHRLNRHSPD